MKIMDKTDDMRDAVRRSRLESKLEHTKAALEDLNYQNVALKEQLDRERDAVRQVSDAAGGKSHRLRRTFALAVAAGGAYVAGSAAGRERYEQIKGWFSRRADEGWSSPTVIRDKAAGAVADAGAKAGDKLGEMSGKVERAANTAEKTLDKAGSAAKDAAEKASRSLGESNGAG